MGNQLMFLDTIKYFQSLASLANSLTDDEKKKKRSKKSAYNLLAKINRYLENFKSILNKTRNG